MHPSPLASSGDNAGAQEIRLLVAWAVGRFPSTAELGTVITTRAVNDLPLNGRNFTQLLELTPGVSRISVDQNSSGGNGISGNAIGTFTFPSVNGQRNRSNMFMLDGVNDLGSYFGTYNYEPIVDGIQEFKVQSHNDLAEFERHPWESMGVSPKFSLRCPELFSPNGEPAASKSVRRHHRGADLHSPCVRRPQ
jgi:hypothetical protein